MWFLPRLQFDIVRVLANQRYYDPGVPRGLGAEVFIQQTPTLVPTAKSGVRARALSCYAWHPYNCTVSVPARDFFL